MIIAVIAIIFIANELPVYETTLLIWTVSESNVKYDRYTLRAAWYSGKRGLQTVD